MSYDEWRFTFGAKTKTEIDAIPQSYLSLGLSVWNSDIKKPEYVNTYMTSSACSNGMDVVFLIDYTGSMGGAINDIKTSVTSITNKIISESGNNYRLGLVIFDEQTANNNAPYFTSPDYTSLPIAQRKITTGSVPNRFQWRTAMQMMTTNNITPFIAQLNKLNTGPFPLGGGVGGPEPADMGVADINTGFAGTFRSNVAKMIILVTDNYPGGPDDNYSQADIDYINNVLTPALMVNGIRVLLMSTAPPNALDTMAIATGGVVSQSFAPQAIEDAIYAVCSIIAGGVKNFVNEDCVTLVNNTGTTLSTGQIVRISASNVVNGCILATSSNDDYLCGVVYRGGANLMPVVVAIQGEYYVKIFAGEATLPTAGRIVTVSTTPGEGDISTATTGATNNVGVCVETLSSYPANRLVKCMIQNFQSV